MVFVADTVDGFVKAGCAEEKAFGETINLATGEGYSIAQIVEQLKFLTGSKAKVTLDPQRQRPKNSEVMRLIGENKKACELIDWAPTTELKVGLMKTIEHFHEHRFANKTIAFVV